jgi:pyruvate/2-oxoglutarate dehydrogenase complex dihydrolipoamide acyltransferase (E2) component
MRLAVKLPQFGESAAEATVMAWLVTPGAPISAEQELVEVQTEKSVLSVAAPRAGVLAELCVEPGAKVAVGAVLAYLEIPGEDETHTPTDIVADADATGLTPSTAALPVPRPATARHTRRPSRVGFYTPRVHTRMDDHGILPADLAAITGTGEGGRVTAEDIDRYLAEGSPMSPMRQAVAASMLRSWERPLATVARTVKIDPVLTHRRTVSGRPSATVYCLRALALAFKDDDRLARRIVGTRINKPVSMDLAIAVEVDDGVLAPVIRKIDTLDLASLTAAVESAVENARKGRATDLGEAVSTVTNYGTFGLTWATAIPQPGQSMILGIGAVRNVPDWDPAAKAWGRGREAELTLTFDHRIADGGAAARLLISIADLLEHPERM